MKTSDIHRIDSIQLLSDYIKHLRGSEQTDIEKKSASKKMVVTKLKAMIRAMWHSNRINIRLNLHA